MRLKFLLFSLIISTGVFAQDTIKTLLITEAIYRAPYDAFIELTNVGEDTINLGTIKIGKFGKHNAFDGTDEFQLPDHDLLPGVSFTLARVEDWTEEQYPLYPDLFDEKSVKSAQWEADMTLDYEGRNSGEGDSITPGIEFTGGWGGGGGYYLEQHLSPTDSVAIDQVGGVLESEEGTNYQSAYDVAGVAGATGFCVLVRKSIVKEGNLDFANARGVGEDDSEWIPIPEPYAGWVPWRAGYWTRGNHGNYNMDENTFVSDDVVFDIPNKTLTVPWGVRKWDDIMLNHLEKKPGIGWYYECNTVSADSNYVSARTGDKLTVYVCGDDADIETFDIVVSEPTEDANWVVPKYRRDADGEFIIWNSVYEGNTHEPYQVTQLETGMDTITKSLFGIEYATRVDTLFKYLEKAPKAEWEIVWVDDVARPEVKNGDILKVTAENGAVKEYYIKVNAYKPSHNAELSAITWPDIPEYLIGIFGWDNGDTIPGFAPTVLNYTIKMPYTEERIPALVATPSDLNSSVEVERAVSMEGDETQRTISFTVTAEDGIEQNVYSIILIKEKSTANTQPFEAEPFLSELVNYDMWSNGFVELCNPGTEIMDLSNYMLVSDNGSTPAEAITNRNTAEEWDARYLKYVPGYKWIDSTNYVVTPRILEKDLNVNTLVYPGDVFVAGHIEPFGQWAWNDDINPTDRCDVIFTTQFNPWGEAMDLNNSAAHPHFAQSWYLFKIVGDSIKEGWKPATDPNDFELIETWGNGTGENWNIGGFSDMGGGCMTFIRKPEYAYGKPGYNESFGTNEDDTEWRRLDPAYWGSKGVFWPLSNTNATADLGKHFVNEVTAYKSTVTSMFYKVSKGYTLESIEGIVTGTTGAEVDGKLVKGDEGQTLTFISGSDGAELASDAVLNANDTLVVLSADGANTTKYVLNVADVGLSSDAVLTSDTYVINHSAGVGTIEGVEYGALLTDVLADITVPAGATLEMIDGEGAYIPTKALNFDTVYVPTPANSDIYLDVLAEDGETEIVYQIIPEVSDDEAFITSYVYAVDQAGLVINYVPQGTNVISFLDNLIPSIGSTVKVMNNMGQERADGIVADDDRVFVTSSDGLNTKVYFISALIEGYYIDTYLAYILSEVYTVDQVQYLVAGVSGSVSDVLANITTSFGAVAVVVDATGAEKTSGLIDHGDMIKVTSANGEIVVLYDMTTVGIDRASVAEFHLYPNPTSGQLSVSGVKEGYNIRVYNSVGAAISDIRVKSNIETISLEDQPAGMYMIVISGDDKLLGTYKAIRK